MKPIKYSPAVGARICERILQGERVKQICEEDNMPCYTTLRKWRDEHEHFARLYDAARRNESDDIYERIQEIEERMLLPSALPAMDAEGNPILDKRGVQLYVRNPEWIEPGVGRSVINSLQWRAEKINPEKYGNRLNLDVGDDGLYKQMLEARARTKKSTNGKKDSA